MAATAVKGLHMKFLVALILGLIALPALAGGGREPPKPNPTPAVTSSSHSGAIASAKSASASEAHATGGNAMAAGGNAEQSQNASANNSQSLSVSSSYEEKRQAPPAFAPAIFASGPCAYGWSAGISSPVGGLTGGKSKTDPGCDRREVARVLTPLNPQLALKVLCADPIVAPLATEDDCKYMQPAIAASAPAPDLSGYVKREELDERDRRMLERATRK